MGIVTPTNICVTASAIGVVAFVCYVYCKNSRVPGKRKQKVLLEKVAMQDIISEIKDPRDQQALLLHEIQYAESLMSDGKFERAVIHFANAIAICNDPDKLVLALKESLPASAFNLLLKILASSYGKRINSSRLREIRGGVYNFYSKRLCASNSFS